MLFVLSSVTSVTVIVISFSGLVSPTKFPEIVIVSCTAYPIPGSFNVISYAGPFLVISNVAGLLPKPSSVSPEPSWPAIATNDLVMFPYVISANVLSVLNAYEVALNPG